ncbi:hypothetical protein [Caudoviricetes sp.]|nr:hypothetical protein [Caudoviricetes sp.]
MGTKYSSVTVSGYNSSPPADDGSTSASNQITWDRIKTKLPDPLNTAIAAINSGLTTAFDYSARSITTSDSAIASDHMKTIEVAPTVSSNVTVTLSDAATMAAGYCVGICNRSNFTATVTRATTSDVIDNTAAAVALMPQTSVGYKVNASTNGYLTMYRGTITVTSGNSGDWVKIGTTQTASASSSVDFTSASYATAFNGTYDTICFKFVDIVPATNATTFGVRVSQASTFLTDAGYSASSTDGSTTAQATTFFHSTSGGSTTVANSYSGEMWITGMNNSTTYKKMHWRFGFINSAGALVNVSGTGVYSTNTTAIDGLRFLMTAGNIASGKFACYGVTK